MLADILKEITRISTKDDVNTSNYLEGISLIDNVFVFTSRIKKIIPIKELTFQSTFKGEQTCEKFNIPSVPEENEMRLFIVESKSFLEDKELIEEVRRAFNQVAEVIELYGKNLRIILK